MGKSLRAIGLMSGTSMDGVDMALIATDGRNVIERQAFASVSYDEIFRERLRQALADAVVMKSRDERPGCLADVEQELTEHNATAVLGFLRDLRLSAADIDLISFHGQTVLHRPEQRLTVQIGCGPQLAALVGTDVIYDLRATDVAAGGQGAPLAPAYHRAMAAKLDSGPIAVLNIGGVANVTFIDSDGGLTAFDTGPGNALLDDFVFARTGDGCDENGCYSGAGTVNDAVLAELMGDAYFTAPPPKSLDRNHFAAGRLSTLVLEDGAATLAAFTVEAVAVSAQHAAEKPRRWMVCGGGRHNPTIMAGLGKRLGADVLTAEAAGFDGDAVEAEAWAYLGVRSKLGLPITFPGTTGVPQAMTGGKLVVR
ncbi:MAG: anhydro-N-acetylmuramic acid kinase [Hyphomicrobiaceae bacterium]|jgi:anhydro-N-acetylmuramic acid kinase